MPNYQTIANALLNSLASEWMRIPAEPLPNFIKFSDLDSFHRVQAHLVRKGTWHVAFGIEGEWHLAFSNSIGVADLLRRLPGIKFEVDT
jgi:hypothetical protein